MSSVLSITAGGMHAAIQRFQTAATDIATGTGDVEQAAIELIMSKITLEAEARVAAVVAQMSDRLLDITV
jgi:hypothetical protein